MSATNRGGKRSEADFYPTPSWCVDRLLEAVKLPGGRWLEPTAGDGAIVRAVNAQRSDVRWRVVELEARFKTGLGQLVGKRATTISSFLDLTPDAAGGSFDVVITNPAVLIGDVCDRARACARDPVHRDVAAPQFLGVRQPRQLHAYARARCLRLAEQTVVLGFGHR